MNNCKDCKWLRERWCYRMPHTETKEKEDWCGEFEAKGECDHDWVDAENAVVSNAEMCLKCRIVRAKE